MPQPPTTPILARELVRNIPFAAQKTFNTDGVVMPVLAPAATLVATFDIGLAVTDPNQFLSPAALPGGTPAQHAVGPFMDVVAFADVVGQFELFYAVDYTCTYRSFGVTAVPAATLVNVSGLRITARFCQVVYTNLAAGNAVVELGCYVRST